MSETHKIEIVNDSRSGLGTASLVLGIIGLVLSCIPFIGIVGIILGFIGLALGIPALISYLKKKKGSLGKAIAGLILSLLAVILGFTITAGVFNAVDEGVKTIDSAVSDMSGDNTDALLESTLDIKFDKFTTDGDEYLESGSVKVTIHNKSGEKFNGSVDIEAVDKDGTRIEKDIVSIDNLAAGQDQTEEIFTTVDSDKFSKMKSATFKAYNVSKY